MSSIETYTANELTPIGDRILVKDMVFGERLTTGGILLPGDDTKSAGIRNRWAEVYAVGPKQKHIAIGEWILVAHGRWTRGMQFIIKGVDMTIRMVDNEDILLVSETPQLDETWTTATTGESDLHRIEGSMHNNAGGGLLD